MKRFSLIIIVFFACSCGETAKKSKGSQNTATNNQNNTATNNSTSGSNNVVPLTCGNGVVDGSERCDSGIPTGDGSCPNACPPQGACTLGRVSGTAAACSAQCEYAVVTSCVNDDGCCPAACDYTSDDDCSASCNNGIVDAGETCDGDCPTSCEDGNACTSDELTGSANNCSASCSNIPVTSCVSGDGCCPTGCTAAMDADCGPTCGNGVVETGETCDGNCAASCNDNVACTADSVSGSAAQCNLQCSNTPITSCQSGDGCCPGGCTFPTDQDCACQPLACGAAGRQCGAPADGCGGTLNCGTCQNGFTCSNFNCVATSGPLPTGSACTAQSTCAGAISPFCVSNPTFKDGYCSSQCQFDNDCASGSHCGQKDANGNGSCLKNCGSNNDCRSGYMCFDQDGDANNSKECMPAGVGTGAIGATCSVVYTCGGGIDAMCLTGNDWPGGYCSEECSFTNLCSNGNWCYPEGVFGVEGFCVDACTSNANCRSGYTCQQFDGLFGTSGTYKGCLKP